MRFRSTRGQSEAVGLAAAIDRGLAPDGGLYVPVEFPQRTVDEFDDVDAFPDIAARWLAPFFRGDALEPHLAEICRSAFNFPILLEELDETTRILELFHGPTAAFKDVGARFLAACVEAIEQQNDDDRPRTVLVATSGDTGGAIASAFHRREGIEVVVLFPLGGVSARQQHQLTCWGDNVRALGVRGVFDDCQRMVKTGFADDAWREEKRLTSANSINIARLLPQSAYYAAATLWNRRRHGDDADFIVPSGNVGNACAALWAGAMGFPLPRVVLACNANRALPDYFEGAPWSGRPSIATLANAMDVGAPSNMERIFDRYPTLDELRRVAAVTSADDPTLRRMIAETHTRYERAVCPHTAAALHARAGQPERVSVVVATAHPAKFETVVEPLVNHVIELPQSLRELEDRPARHVEIAPDFDALKRELAD